MRSRWLSRVVFGLLAIHLAIGIAVGLRNTALRLRAAVRSAGLSMAEMRTRILLAGWRALRRPDARLLLLAGLVPAAVGWAAYAVSTRLEHLLGETWDRFLLQGLVPPAIVLAIALQKTFARRVDFAPPRSTQEQRRS